MTIVIIVVLVGGYLAGRLHGRAAWHAWKAAELWRLQGLADDEPKPVELGVPAWSASEVLEIFRGPKPPLLRIWPSPKADHRAHKIGAKR